MSDVDVDERALAARTGATIRSLRVGSQQSMRDVAAKAGISQPFLSQIERGLSMPSMVTVYRLAEALGVDPGDLLPSSAGARIAVVRRGEGRLLPVADRPDAAHGRVLVDSRDSGPQIIEYRIERDQYLGGWYATSGMITVFLIAGTLDIDVEGAGTFRLVAGDLIVLPAPVRHRWLLVDGAPADALLIRESA